MKEIMKEKIVIFVIGLLLGSVISTGAFLVYTKTSHSHNQGHQQMQLPNGSPPMMQNNKGNQNNQNNQNNQPPSMPNGESNQNSQNNQNGQPPEAPSNNDNQTNNG